MTTDQILTPEDQDVENLGILNDNIYEMFFAQNTIIDMDFRWDMINLVKSEDEETREQLATYAQTIEDFLKYASNFPDRVASALALLKGQRKPGELVDEINNTGNMKKETTYALMGGIAMLVLVMSSSAFADIYSMMRSYSIAPIIAAKSLAETACVSVPDGRVLPIVDARVSARASSVLRQWTDQSGKPFLTGTVVTIDGRKVEQFDGSQVNVVLCQT